MMKENKIVMNLQVNTYDIDLAGHVNNIVYIKWLEDLRNKFFDEKFGLDKIIFNKYYPVVISTSINYRQQIRIFDKPVGIIELCNYRHGIITLKAVIKLKDNIAAFAEQRCVILNLNNSKMISKENFDNLLKVKSKV